MLKLFVQQYIKLLVWTLTDKTTSKIRMDLALVENGLARDIAQARSMISCGLVFIGDKKAEASSYISQEDILSGKIRVKYSKQYVSRGAVKLETVFKEQPLIVKDFKCIDVGASTGGFTQLLLEKGASFVYAVDVGKGIIDYKLRTDNRVMVLEGINARLLDQYDIINSNIQKESLDIAVFDLSFISIKKVVPVVLPYLKKGAYVVPLIKPQFEADRADIGEKGVVSDQGVVSRILEDMRAFFIALDLDIVAITASQIKGPSGNQEYFYTMLKKG